tara:strand:+ start:156 stop:518 length:363 start_codon:yes stop_codon:yes gene_type:complete
MNSKNTSALIGLGAIGTLLAYYGYQYLDDDEKEHPEKIETQKEVTENKDKELENSKVNEENKDINEITTEKPEIKTTLDASSNNIKMEVTEQINNEKNKWSNYWAGQYNEIDKSKEIDVQ